MKDMTRRHFIGLGVLTASALGLSACSQSANTPQTTLPTTSNQSSSNGENEAPQSSELRFLTGGQSGTYYAFGQLLAQHASNNAGVPIIALTSDGSKANIDAFEDGITELGFSQSDVATYAYEGTNLFEGAPTTSFSAVGALYDEQVQIVTCNPDIKTISDLKGKRVSIGAPNSGVYFNALAILNAYDLSEQDIIPTYQSFGDSTDSLKNEQIDAAFIVAGTPTTAITDLCASKKSYFIALDEQHLKSLLSGSPYYEKSVIKKGSYSGQDEDITTIAVSALILAANKLSNKDVYAFVKDIFESIKDPEVVSAHAKYKELSLKKAASIKTLPYHPGAAKFFEEEGLSVKTA